VLGFWSTPARKIQKKHQIIQIKSKKSFLALLSSLIPGFLFYYLPLSKIEKHNHNCAKVEIPDYFLDHQHSQLIYKKFYKKLIKNSDYRRKWYNTYKFYQPVALSNQVMTWNKINTLLEQHNIPLDLKFDCVVAIFSGGGFIGKRMANIMNIKKVYYMDSKMWSGKGDVEQLIQVKKLAKNQAVNIPTKLLCNPKKIRKKRILLVDDTTATGTTLKNCKQHLLKLGAKSVHTYVMITHNPKFTDFYSSTDKVPLFWPWGYELN
jgi:hypoxanthine phosphoribosyltransferase